MSIVLVGSSSGSITLQEPAVAGTTVLNLPATSGTVLTTGSTFAGTGPAFSAFKSTPQTLSSGVGTKITFETEVFDTNNNFASSRFTPTVAGYYQINANATLGGSDTGVAVIIYKNGSEESRGWSVPISGVFNACATACKVVYLNGSTDYIESYAFQAIGSNRDINAGISQTALSGALVRAA
jgi:hypothetical protein